MSLALRLFQLEFVKAVTYRLDFFTRIVGKALTISLTAWFLWSSIFHNRGVDSVGGVSLGEMATYYFALPLTLGLVLASDFASISNDIYEGTLSKYLLYPRSFLAFTYIQRYSAAAVSSLPYVVLGAVAWVFFPERAAVSLAPGVLAQFLLLCAAAAPCYFLLASIFDVLAFWFEQTWSLRSIVRFTVLFLGGGFMPLELLPESMRAWTRWLPFESMVGLPTILLARGSLPEGTLAHSLPVLLAWTVVFGVVFAGVWRTGLRNFSGSGM